MKRFLIFALFLILALPVNAEIIFTDNNVTVENYWYKNSIEVQKVDKVARKLIHENKLKRASVRVERNLNSVNASTNIYSKTVYITKGILPYISSDDELAFILGHELAHAQEAYGGVLTLISMKFNSKKYEYKADLRAVDYMVKAGYNPVAGIIIGNKLLDEPLWDWGFTYTHPKGSKRLTKMYEYIYTKYPEYLNSPLAKDKAFVDFVNGNDKELNSFKQKYEKKHKNL